jgi:uncharacterized membrane protein YraQ (UPF0718 family)
MTKPTGTKSAEAPLLDRSVIFFGLAALLAGAICFWLRGFVAVERALLAAAEVIWSIAPQIVGGVLIAGLVQVLVPKDAVSRWLGEEAGMRGLFIAQAAGALTPGGPFGSFALVYALGKVGADIGVLVCYLTSWTTISLLRLVIWEIPFLGLEFSLVRFVISLPMGIIAGLLARRLARQWGWHTTESIVR